MVRCSLQSHVSWRMLQHMIAVRRRSGSEMLSCVKSLFRSLLTHLSMSSVSVVFSLPLHLWMGGGRNKGMVWFPSGLSFPLTSASWTLHQQKSGTVRKREQWEGNWEHTPSPSALGQAAVKWRCVCVNWESRTEGISLGPFGSAFQIGHITTWIFAWTQQHPRKLKISIIQNLLYELSLVENLRSSHRTLNPRLDHG